ncbi:MULTISPECIES: DUF6616 family protein [Paracoccaceae]|uniref:DUF6616 family protein n=1 Tax=Paracoccaceae TaxID=31989 RepID=UPI001571C291|nr:MULTISPECIES: DUF6616 family protein [Paracoccaceae]MBJ2153469.1 hypothetical protein [Paracoccus sp. IB05]NTT88435.1 hypothetical protein [Tabrizicola sp. SY72]
MAHYLAELYSPKTAWLALDQNGRQEFFKAVGSGMGSLSALGVEAIALGETNAATLHAPSQKFFAIWRAPDAAAMNALVSGIAASGWHDYFDTINATGSGVDLNGHLAQLAAL